MDLEESKTRIRTAEGVINDAYAAIAPDKLKAKRAELAVRQNDRSEERRVGKEC